MLLNKELMGANKGQKGMYDQTGPKTSEVKPPMVPPQPKLKRHDYDVFNNVNKEIKGEYVEINALKGVDNFCSDEVENAVNALYQKMIEAEKYIKEVPKQSKVIDM
jgi:hypothetical protein